MSYLNPTRFTFAGSFQAAPSTINNTPANFGKEATSQTQQSWNPEGNAFFRVQNCTVRSALLEGAASAGDPILGLSFVSTDKPVPGKLVDLDPNQQMVSEVWGMRLQLGTAGDPNSFVGTFKVAAFTDLWQRRQVAPPPAPQGGSPYLSASYHSILEGIEWGGNPTSPLLRRMKELSLAALSIKFNVDLYNWYNPAQGPTPANEPSAFTFGRIVGAVGPAIAGEPDHFISGRSLVPFGNGALNFAPCQVGEDAIHLDLGNSMPTLPNGSIDPSQGDLRLAILNPVALTPPSDDLVAQKGGSPEAMAAASNVALTDFVFTQPIDYVNYPANSGLASVPFNPTMRSSLENAPLGIVRIDAQGEATEILLSENPDGWLLRADNFVFRLDPGDAINMRVRATQFGRTPPAGLEIGLTSRLLGKPKGGMAALNIPGSILTGADGWAELPIIAGDPGYPRRSLKIDGQVYAIDYDLTDFPIPNAFQNPSSFISGMIYTDWSKVAANFASPTWDGDVEAVLNQYDVLYPVMRDKIGIALGDYEAVRANIEVILRYMSFTRTDPRHMPVTRDLSKSKLQLVKNWAAHGSPQS
ncbi:MAG TPA: hypothetical protein VJU77_04785 [Chthoniobacterales bacterium]|nr:hypothetical protein [Chthoniobacterales bacterium]